MFTRRTIYSFERTTKVSCYKYLHCRGKTKVSYYILLRENKSIILHHVLPNSPENVFLAAYVMLKLLQQHRNCQTKRTEQFPSEGGEQTFPMVSLHANKMFLNGNAIANELPNIHFSLTTVRDTSLTGIQTYSIYLSRIISKPPWISIEKFVLSSKFSLYSLWINGKP